jgi:hypothetical protein
VNSYYKIFVSVISAVAIASTSVLFADSKTRKNIVEEISGLQANSQEVIVDLLCELSEKNLFEFNKLFNCVVSEKGALSYDYAIALKEKKLIGTHDAPGEMLARTFKLLKQIIDDFNKENKANCCLVCCKKCCGGCFVSWGRENGMRRLNFTPNNAVKLVSAISNKGSVTKSQEIVASQVESVLARLATNQID